MARLSCLQRLFVVLLAFIVFSALPGMAPLVASYGQLGPDVAAGGPRLAGLAATLAPDRGDDGSSGSAGQLLLPAQWQSLSLAVAYQFDSDGLTAPAVSGVRRDYGQARSALPRPFHLGVPTSSYDAQAPPAI